MRIVIFVYKNNLCHKNCDTQLTIIIWSVL